MVRLLYFHRRLCPTAAVSSVLEMQPARNQNYFNPTFLVASHTTELGPEDEALIGLNVDSRKLVTYSGGNDQIEALNNFVIALYVKNQHTSKAFPISKDVSLLDDLMSCPFMTVQFCLVRLTCLVKMAVDRPVARVRPYRGESHRIALRHLLVHANKENENKTTSDPCLV